MSGRTRRTMVITAPDGTEVTEVTAGGYTVAGVIRNDHGQWHIAAHGYSLDSVYNRTHALYNKGSYQAMYVGDLIEKTAPVISKYFGTHDLHLSQIFIPGRNWVKDGGYAGCSRLRNLAKELNVTAVSVRDGSGRTANFQMTEILASMNARAKSAK